MLPRFTPPDFESLKNAFGHSSALVPASDPAARTRWLTQLTYVRPAISRLDTALTLAQVLGGGTAVPPPVLLLGQLPLPKNSNAEDKWLALPIDTANPPDKGRVAFACVTQGDWTNKNNPYAGLLVDEWQERIPCKVWTADDQLGHVSGCAPETAAVAFHYEEPKARPPQALLLAVCPDRREKWDDDLVTGILEEALELAKIRTVDLDSMRQVGQILPALYFPFNLQDATISTNFAILEEARRGPAVVR